MISTGYFQQWIKGIWTERYTTNDIRCSNKCVSISPDIVCGIIRKSEISQSLEAARFAFRIVRSPWNLTGTPAAQLPKCLSNFKAIRIFQQPILNLRHFARCHDKTSYRILKRCLGTVISIMIFVQTLLYTSNNCIWKRRIGLIQFISFSCGLVTPYGGRNIVAWRYQAITWTNVDLSSLRSSDVHLRAISLEISHPSVTKINLKIKYLKCHSNFPGFIEISHGSMS